MVTHQDYHRIQILHSDGQDNGPGYWPTPGDSDASKLVKKAGKDVPEKVPRLKPQMLRLAEDDPRFTEWRIKLGILLKQELAPNPQEGLSWYVEFPRGYWLYEKSKHLWVSGHPVKSKLFRSPQEFGVHLLWLMSGSKDNQDCCCVHCNPLKTLLPVEDLTIEPAPATAPPPKVIKVAPPPKAVKPVQAPAAAPPAAPKTITPVPVPTIPPAARAPPAAPTPIPAPAPAAAPAPKPVPAPSQPAQAAQAAPPVSAPVSAPAPSPAISQPITNPPASMPAAPAVAEPQFPPYSSQVSPTFFRVGELVWFQVTPSWRIGLIARADYQAKQYEILPISHSAFNQNQLQPKIENALRPFLAFTVPPVSHTELAGKSFDVIPWAAHLQKLAAETGKREALLLDASKLAATKISQSYSLFTHLHDSEGGLKSNYHGTFLGAERVEVNDALRVRITPDQKLGPEWQDALLGLREICTGSTWAGAVFFKGDLLAALSGDDATPPGATVVSPELLPPVLREEFAFRQMVSPKARWRIVLLRQGAVLREDDIRGRFYPSTRLLPVLAHPNLAPLQQELNSGVVRESARQLNQRMDTFKDGYIGLKRTRMETVGDAIPHGSAALFVYDSAVREISDGDVSMTTQ
ncbi:hypothetical protein F5X68DRAFT_275704 [Plectosphaerella plurivora]|uniref:Uncharacterized protein n=1 Tax=Plectosphaerella plurivora TaxID=936078 RepID=A0A9P8VD08_9PEZI|nr:hypothetical protein F5X68DRAFT_275704 [Plectosphaerella plurivora]